MYATLKVPNYKLDGCFSRLVDVTNYNNTIVAENVGSHYVVTHWRTEILRFNTGTNEIEHLAHWPISQTTSTLIGRLLRSLDWRSVERYLDRLEAAGSSDVKRLRKMTRR